MIFELLVAGAFALATLRRYSVAHTVTLTSFAFFLSSGLNTVSGTPVYGDPRLTDAVNVNPWLQPCGVEAQLNKTASQEKTPREQTLEHRDARCIMSRVLTQLDVAYDHYNMSKRKLRKIHPRVHNLTNYDYNWLPKEEIQWYRKDSMNSCLEIGKKAERILPRLYDTLQKFAVTFHHLNNARLRDANHFNPTKKMKRWNDIMKKFYSQVLLVLCEVDAAIQNLGLHLPVTHNDLIVPKFDKVNDSTRMLVHDWGALLYYKDFLRSWKRIMTHATKGEPGTCHSIKNGMRHLRAKGAKKGKKGVGRSKKLVKMRKHNGPTKRRPIAPARNGTALRRPKKGPPRSRQMRNRLKKPIDMSQACENAE